MIAGAALHDVGKIFEIEGTGVYEKTLEGRLCGHVIQGRDLTREAALELEFSDMGLLTQLEHIIFPIMGSRIRLAGPAKDPGSFYRALLDDLNAKLKMIDDHMAKGDKGSGFTDYHRVLKREFMAPKKES